MATKQKAEGPVENHPKEPTTLPVKHEFEWKFSIQGWDPKDELQESSNKLETARQALNHGWYAIDEPQISTEEPHDDVVALTYVVRVVPNDSDRPVDGWLDKQQIANPER